jgi:hypothetical protein
VGARWAKGVWPNLHAAGWGGLPGRMTEPRVPDAFWAWVAPLLPEGPPRPKGDRPPLDDRKVFDGILFAPQAAGPLTLRRSARPRSAT